MEESYDLGNLEYFINISKNSIETSTKTIETNTQRMDLISKDLLVHGDVKKLLIKLKNSKMFEKKDFILNTINTALADVFHDQIVKIDLVASNTNQEASKLNIKYDIVLYQNGIEMARNDKLLTKNGGGVLSFISILFKILVGFIYSRNRFYVFDESLSEVSEVYLPRMGQFLQKFCAKHNFTIILITHTPVIAEYSDIVYRLDGEFEKGIPTLRIDSIEGDYPEENYIYSKIENFQSIKKLEFRYKGFTTIIGKNNIGKSASFRAVNSILFNNFDIKEFPRMESEDKPDKLLNTKVEFGFFSKQDDPQNEVTKIGFYKKGQSIIWYFDGMEFVGKNLAVEKVREKVESIGFRYLKLKDQYKNFKGNLKDQTERLAITTQQDDYYIIGGKSTDTAKVFDFLFDSREVTLALIELNNDIQKFENELNSLNLANGELTFIISRSRIELNRWMTLYKITLIKELKHQLEIDGFNKNHYHQIQEELILCNKIINVADLIWKIEFQNTISNNLNNSFNYLTRMITAIEKLVVTGYNIGVIQTLMVNFTNHNLLKKYYEKLVINRQIIMLNEILLVNSVHDNNVKILNYLRSKQYILDKLINNLSSRSILEQMFINIDKLNVGVDRVNYLNMKSEKITKLMTTGQSLLKIKSLIADISGIFEYRNKLDSILNYNIKFSKLADAAISKLHLENFILSITNEIEKNNKQIAYATNMRTTLEQLPASYNLTPCTSCSTLGYTCNH